MSTIQIPFSGFYESMWSKAVEYEAERDSEYRAEQEEESGFPVELQLDSSELCECLNDATNFPAAEYKIAREYVAFFNDELTERLGFNPGFVFSDMSSPKYYNFETDRVFATIPDKTIRALFRMSETDKHERFKAKIRERHTSRDGFISHYSCRPDEWIERNPLEYDHNELMTLLLSQIDESDFDEIEWSIMESMNEGIFRAWNDSVDWGGFDLKTKEKRAEKLAGLIDSDPDKAARIVATNEQAAGLVAQAYDDYVIDLESREFDSMVREYKESHYRCPLTPDLFANVNAGVQL